MARLGLPIGSLKTTVQPVRRLVKSCHNASVPVIFTRYVLRPDYVDAGYFATLFPLAKDVHALASDTLDAEFLGDLKPGPEDFLVDKTRYSAFYNTNLEVILRGLNVNSLIVCGVTTEMCVESTVRDAFYRDFRILLVKDAVAAADDARHEAALRTIEYGFAKLVDVGQIAEALSKPHIESAKRR